MLKIISPFILLFMSLSAGAETFPKDLIDVQRTKQSMEMGIKASLLSGCVNRGKTKDECQSETAIVDKLDLDGILEKVYAEVYTPEQMKELYQFYASPLGRKYSQGMLVIAAQQMNYPLGMEMPNISAQEDKAIREYQASKTSKLEKDTALKLRASINRYLSVALKEAADDQ